MGFDLWEVVSVCVSVLLSCVLCAILFLVLFPSGDQPPLVLLCVKQVGAELCWDVFLCRKELLYVWRWGCILAHWGMLLCAWLCLLGGAAVSVNDCRKGGGWSVLCGVCEKCFPVFLETGLSLIFCELGFCCCVVWVVVPLAHERSP